MNHRYGFAPAAEALLLATLTAGCKLDMSCGELSCDGHPPPTGQGSNSGTSGWIAGGSGGARVGGSAGAEPGGMSGSSGHADAGGGGAGGGSTGGAGGSAGGAGGSQGGASGGGQGGEGPQAICPPYASKASLCEEASFQGSACPIRSETNFYSCLESFAPGKDGSLLALVRGIPAGSELGAKYQLDLLTITPDSTLSIVPNVSPSTRASVTMEDSGTPHLISRSTYEPSAILERSPPAFAPEVAFAPAPGQDPPTIAGYEQASDGLRHLLLTQSSPQHLWLLRRGLDGAWTTTLDDPSLSLATLLMTPDDQPSLVLFRSTKDGSGFLYRAADGVETPVWSLPPTELFTTTQAALLGTPPSLSPVLGYHPHGNIGRPEHRLIIRNAGGTYEQKTVGGYTQPCVLAPTPGAQCPETGTCDEAGTTVFALALARTDDGTVWAASVQNTFVRKRSSVGTKSTVLGQCEYEDTLTNSTYTRPVLTIARINPADGSLSTWFESPIWWTYTPGIMYAAARGSRLYVAVPEAEEKFHLSSFETAP